MPGRGERKKNYNRKIHSSTIYLSTSHSLSGNSAFCQLNYDSTCASKHSSVSPSWFVVHSSVPASEHHCCRVHFGVFTRYVLLDTIIIFPYTMSSHFQPPLMPSPCLAGACSHMSGSWFLLGPVVDRFILGPCVCLLLFPVSFGILVAPPMSALCVDLSIRPLGHVCVLATKECLAVLPVSAGTRPLLALGFFRQCQDVC